MSREDHLVYLRLALSQARKSPPKATNFCVGAVLVDPVSDSIISTGFTLELPGNTHAEQCCLAKLAAMHNVPEESVGTVLPAAGAVLYTTMEPCYVRLSGNEPCVQRILGTRGNGVKGIVKVVYGVGEPETFVGENRGRRMLSEKGVEVLCIEGLEKEILEVATAGHEKTKES